MKNNYWPRFGSCCINNVRLALFLPLAFLLTVLFPSGCSTSLSPFERVEEWFILLDYDAARISFADRQLQNYDLAILDADSHPDLSSFKPGAFLLAYVSVGEAENYRFYWDEVKGASFVLGENPDWPGSFYVDVRDKNWQKIILEELIPRVRQAGFGGILLDTLDTAVFLEEKDPEKFLGSRAAMRDLIHAIHVRYPELLLVSNNGFAILPDIALYLNAMLAEDVFMTPDFVRGGYVKASAAEREYKITLLQQLHRQYDLPVFVIDYASRKDRQAIRYCVGENQKLGFKPYVAEKGLCDIYPNE